MATAAHKAISKSKGPGSDGVFVWTLRSGETLELPSMATAEISMGAVEDFASQASDNPLFQLGAQMKFLRSFISKEAGDKLRGMTSSEFVEFVSAWGDHSGTTVGELSAS